LRLWGRQQQIGAGDLKIDYRLEIRLVFGMHEPLCGHAVFRAKALLFSSRVILAPKKRNREGTCGTVFSYSFSKKRA
jgi:hypothetical protein